MFTTRPVPLSWLNNSLQVGNNFGMVFNKSAGAVNPCSSLPQWPTNMVRFGLGYTFLRMRIASIMVKVPVPLSVAPGAAIPRIEVGRKHYILIRFFGAFYFANNIKGWHNAKLFRFGLYGDLWFARRFRLRR
jgi:hypothetical protein